LGIGLDCWRMIVRAGIGMAFGMEFENTIAFLHSDGYQKTGWASSQNSRTLQKTKTDNRTEDSNAITVPTVHMRSPMQSSLFTPLLQ
jgi:hypothetical protein